MDEPAPPEGASMPFATPTEAAAIALYEMFVTYMKVGFNERQALIFLAELVAAHNRNNKE